MSHTYFGRLPVQRVNRAWRGSSIFDPNALCATPHTGQTQPEQDIYILVWFLDLGFRQFFFFWLVVFTE